MISRRFHPDLRHSLRSLLLLTLLALLAAPLSRAQLVEVGDGEPGPVKAQHLTAELTTVRPELAPGGTVQAGLILTLEDGWHVYWVNAGDSGEPPAIKWTLPPSITSGPLQFPVPTRLPLGPLMDYGYEGQAAYPFKLSASPTAKPGKVHLDAHVTWLVCAAQCFPGKAHLGLDLNVLPATAAASLPEPAVVGSLGQALKQIPAPLPASMSVSALADGKSIGLTFHTGKRQTSVEFYPFNPEQIDNAAPQQVEPLSDGVRVVLKRASDSTTMPTALHGVLKFGTDESYDITAPVKPGAVAPVAAATRANGTASSPADITLLGELGLAFLGGLVLNLMPCVFPVLFLKGLGLVHSSTEEKRRQRVHGLIYTLGILVSFWVVVGALLLLRAGGRQVGWGFQMQSSTLR